MSAYVRGLSVLGLAWVATSAWAAAEPAQPRGVTVAGEAEVRTKPDRIVITLGVESRAKELAAARRDNESRSHQVLEALRAAGVPPASIRTDYLAVNPIYDWKDETRLSSYAVYKRFVVTLGDPGNLEATLWSAVDRGAAAVLGVEFRTSELKRFRDQARALAMQAARDKAQKLAAELGAHVGKVQNITEESWGGYWDWWSSYMWSGGHQMSQNLVAYAQSPRASQDTEGTPLGEIPVSARVQVTFAIE